MLIARLSRWLWWVFAIAIVGVAVLLSAARILLPGMAEYRAQIETAAGALIGRQVSIGSLDAAWQGLSPVLRLKQVVVEDPQFADGVVAADEVRVGLDVVKSLTQRAWFTSGIRIIGVSVSLQTDLSNWRGDARRIGPLLWLLQQKSIALEEVQLHWRDAGLSAKPLHLSDLALQLVNEGDRHQLLLQSRLSPSLGEALTLAADLRGPLDNLNTWKGQLYIRSLGLDLATATGWFPQAGLRAAGQADVEMWAELQDRKLAWGAGRVRVQSPILSAAAMTTSPFSADLLSSAFRWQIVESGWQIDLQDLGVRRGGRVVWPASNISLAANTTQRLELRGTASHIALEELGGIAALLPWLDEQAVSLLQELQPVGRLRDAEFSVDLPESAPPQVFLRSRFEELGFAPRGSAPGLQGLSGSLQGSLQAGTLRLDTAQASLLMPKLFGAPLPLSSLNGQLHWQRYAHVLRVDSQRLSASSGDIAVAARLQLDWPDGAASPWLDLQVDTDPFALAQVSTVLPDRILSPKATAWLQGAFGAGSVHDAHLLLQGRLDQLPFDAGEGRLEARFEFEDATLDFHPQWGRLAGLHGSALFLGRSMRITADKARILESEVQRAVASIDDLQRPVLDVEGTVGGTLSGMLQYVASSPLQTRFGAAIEQVEAQGDAQLHLTLGIPLKRELGKTRVEGSVVLDENALSHRRHELTVSDINGTLHFTRDGVNARKARGVFLDEPLTLSVYQGGESGRSKTVIDIEGKLDVLQWLRPSYPGVVPLADGLADWHVLVHIPNQRRPDEPRYEVQLQSDLVGMAIQLPEPLHKEKQQARNLLVNWVSDQRSVQTVMISYADVLDARLLPTPDSAAIQRADIRFGGKLARLPEDNQIHIGGELERLDPGQWLTLFDKPGAGKVPRPDARTIPPLAMDLTVGELSLLGQRINQVRMQSRPSDPWRFQVSGEGAAGSVRWVPAIAARPAKLQVDLQHLHMEQTAPAEGEDRRLSRPSALPDLDIAVGDLRWRGREFGRVGIRGYRVGGNMEFEQLSMDCKAVVFNANGYWREENGIQRTRFSADILGGEVDELLKLLGDTSVVQGGELSGNVTLNWRGGPAAFSLETLEGDLFLTARDGRLARVDEGAAKLLNLFSLNSLQRRLNLDFNDVLKEGFSFNKMSGHLVVMDGDAFTTDFTIEGSSAVIAISGRTGLIERDYDQIVTVTPQVSSSLPIAGAIAGGPAVGAAVFLAEKLVGKEFNRMTEIQYHVSGTWDKPVYERLSRKREADSGASGESQ